MLSALQYHPLLVKPNQHELAELFEVAQFKNWQEILPYGEQLQKMGAENVLVSLGANGALLFAKTGIYHTDAIQGDLINSVGAGDSMVAGFISQIYQNNSIIKALQYGVACGSATAFSMDLAEYPVISACLPLVQIQKIQQ